jgi:hypothetical protein
LEEEQIWGWDGGSSILFRLGKLELLSDMEVEIAEQAVGQIRTGGLYLGVNCIEVAFKTVELSGLTLGSTLYPE